MKQEIREATVKLKNRIIPYASCRVPKPNFCESCKKFEGEGFLYLDAHHIVPLTLCGVHSTENIIFLCPTCHNLIHAKKLFLLKKGKQNLSLLLYHPELKKYRKNEPTTNQIGD